MTRFAWFKGAMGAVVGVALAAGLLLVKSQGAKGPSYVAGTQLFLSRCATCHAREPGEQSSLGPSLFGLAERAASRVSGKDPAEYVVQSLFEPAAFVVPGYPPVMPGQLLDDANDEEIRSLVGYVLSLGGEVDPALVQQVKLPARVAPVRFSFSRAEMEGAEALFWGKGRCSNCHSTHADDQDASIAPRIFHVGLSEAKIRTGLTRHPAAANALKFLVGQPKPPLDAPATTIPAGAAKDPAMPGVAAPAPAFEGVLLEAGPESITLLAGPWPPHELVVSTASIQDPALGTAPEHPPLVLTDQETESLVKLLLILN